MSRLRNAVITAGLAALSFGSICVVGGQGPAVAVDPCALADDPCTATPIVDVASCVADGDVAAGISFACLASVDPSTGRVLSPLTVSQLSPGDVGMTIHVGNPLLNDPDIVLASIADRGQDDDGYDLVQVSDALLDAVGEPTDPYNWAYDSLWSYGFCSKDGCTEVGKVKIQGGININGRQIRYRYRISVWESPTISPGIEVKCIEIRDHAPDGSCGSDSFAAPDFGSSYSLPSSWPNYDPSSHSFYLSDAGKYTVSAKFTWNAYDGYNFVYRTGGLRSTYFRCKRASDPPDVDECVFPYE